MPHKTPVPQTPEEYVAWIQMLSATGVDLVPLAEGLARENFAMRAAIDEVRGQQQEVRAEMEALCAPEHYPATVTAVHRNGRLTVEVYGAGMHLHVPLHPDVAPDQVRVGSRGLLSKARNCLLHVDGISTTWTEVGSFESFACDRQRILLRYQDQLVVATPTDDLAQAELHKGDLVGFDRDGPRLAYTKLEPPGKDDLFFETTPSDRFEELGGLDKEIALLKRMIHFRFQHPGLATKYRLPSKRGVLLEGPPGNGKTKIARCLAGFIAGLVPAGECRFMTIAGSSDYSMWLGQTEQRLIARFDAARELASRGGVPVLIFFDEIDALGRRRGTDYGSGAPDRILGCLLSLLDGVQQVSNVIVVGATNRADTLDPGLLRPGRLGDLKLRIPAPNRTAAHAILMRYLDNGIPLAPAGAELPMLVESILSRVYSSRGEYAELARVLLRDGRKIAVGGRDLVSGATLENIVRLAAEDAADREALTGEAGIHEADLTVALDRELRSTAALLSPQNVRGYATRLPQEADPVAVEPVSRASSSGPYARAWEGKGASL